MIADTHTHTQTNKHTHTHTHKVKTVVSRTPFTYLETPVFIVNSGLGEPGTVSVKIYCVHLIFI